MENVIQASQNFRSKILEERLAKGPKEPDHFDLGDFVCVSYTSRPPSKLHPLWQGPFIVSERNKNIYQCYDLITHKIKTFDFARLKRYFVTNDAENVWVVSQDNDSYIVDSITDHEGDPKRLSALFFRVHWSGYDISEDTWLPFHKVKELETLDIYLKYFPDLMKRLNGRSFEKGQLWCIFNLEDFPPYLANS